MTEIKTIVSFTFLGTKHHRDTHRSVLVSAHDQINELAQNPNSPVAARLFDGPGCRGTKEHPMPGSYVYKDGKKIADMDLAAKEERNFRDVMTENYHAATGVGIESSILEAITYLDEIIGQNKGEIPEQINLQGFSRGADNCVRLANVLYHLYPQIKVNLFLVDPVPGPWRRDDPESYHIPPNVDDCQITLMLNEHRNPFDPQHNERYIFSNPQTTAVFHYMPGRHGAGLSTNEGADITPAVSQVLVQDSLLKFNIHHAVLPKQAANLNWHQSQGSKSAPIPLDKPRKSLTKNERFHELSKAMLAYHTLANRKKVRFYHKRRVFTERSHYVLDSNLFIDSEHRALCKMLYPAVFNWFFEKNFTPANHQPYSKEDVFDELQKLSTKHKKFYDQLLTHFQIRTINSVQDMIDPHGVARNEKIGYDEPLVIDELSYLQYCLSTIVNQYHYRVPATWFGNWLPGQSEIMTKSWESGYLEKDIRKALNLSAYLPPAEGKALLQDLIVEIKANPREEYFFHEIQTIIHDSEKYNKAVLSVLKRYEPLLSDDYAHLIKTCTDLIQKVMSNPVKNNYQKRLEIQSYLLSFNTNVNRLNVKFADKNILCEQLFNNINVLSAPSYAEPKLLETTIFELEAYRKRQKFWSYFPFSQSIRLYNPENMALVDRVIGDLNQIKHSGTPQADLGRIEMVLNEASMQYASSHKQEKQDTNFGFWKKHEAFKVDPLNKLLEKHLKKVTYVSNLIFSIPKAPDQAHSMQVSPK